MLEIIETALALAAFVVWTVAMIAGVRASRHRRPGVSKSYLASHGRAFFTGSAFTPEAAPHLRRLRIAAGAFFTLVVVIAIVVAFAAGDVQRHGAAGTP